MRECVKSIRSLFSLIELLIVVAVILILLSLIQPSMQQMLYQSKLIVCLNQLRQSSIFVITYTDDNNDKYPVIEGNYDRYALSHNGIDRRELYLDVFESIDKNLLCPLNEFPSVEDSTALNIYQSYDIFFGGYLNADSPESGMFHANRDTFYDDKQFNVLMGDYLRTTSTAMHSAHPAADLSYFSLDTDKWCFGSFLEIGSSIYVSDLDRNFVFKDGSAKTFEQINVSNVNNIDSRFIKVSNSPTLDMSKHPYFSYAPYEGSK